MEIKKWWWIVIVSFSLSVGCTSHSIPSEVTEVDRDSVGISKRDGVVVYTTIPITITTTIE